jgi:hypothetical protein
MNGKRLEALSCARERARAESCFTPCHRDDSLLQNFPVRRGVPPVGAAFSFSPVGSSFEQFSKLQECPGVSICAGMKSISRGAVVGCPKIHGKPARIAGAGPGVREGEQEFAVGFCEGKARGKKVRNQTSMKGRDTRQDHE